MEKLTATFSRLPRCDRLNVDEGRASTTVTAIGLSPQCANNTPGENGCIQSIRLRLTATVIDMCFVCSYAWDVSGTFLLSFVSRLP